MFKRKLYKCKFEGCEVCLPILSKGYCNFHNSIVFPKVKKAYKIPKQTAKNKIAKKEKSDLLRPFFIKHENIIKSKGLCCENCGEKLVGSFFECAHILDKQRYKSVMVDDDNLVYLCCGLMGESNCHSVFDNFGKNNLENLSKMFIFATLIEKYNKMRDKVTENGKLKNLFEDACTKS